MSKRSLFVVGDDAQSIYAFRGSKIEIILNFETEYPGTREIILNQNYRSTQPILDLAEKVLSHNPEQKKKSLFTDNQDTIKVKYHIARNERDEAEYIIQQIYSQYVDTEKGQVEDVGGIEFIPDESTEPTPGANMSVIDTAINNMFDFYLSDSNFSNSLTAYNPQSWQVPSYNWKSVPSLNNCAVLYRTHSQSRSVEEAFLKHKVPYRLVSGVRFLDRKEVKDVMAILKYLLNSDDNLSLNRFLPLVMDGVGPKTMEKITAYLEDFNYPLAPRYQQNVVELMTKIHSVWEQTTSLIEMTKDLLVVCGYMRYLQNEYSEKTEREARMENIGELYSLMFVFDEDQTIPLSDRLRDFLAQISLMSGLDTDEEDSTPKISLMSLHQSKGLEFETVFLIGCEDGLLPHGNSLIEPGGFEEEVRLAYVGVTRAKKYLHLISADSRIQFGQIKANPPSRIFRPFLDTYCQRVR
jgi:superfamily I DNA/RNA helicase